MKGFAAPPNNTFVRLIESLGYSMPGCRLYKYGVSGNASGGRSPNFATEIRFSQELRKPSFYNLDYNEDDVLFDHLLQEEGNARSVLITDGVYSARQSELQSEVVKAIDKWLKKGRYFGILIFHSPFQGNLYSENERRWVPNVNEGARPFYAFVFSPNEKGFRDLRESLRDEFKDMRSLVFPREAISCTLNPEVKPGLEYKDVPAASPFYLHAYNQSLFGPDGVAELNYEFLCAPPADYPVAEFSPELKIDSYSWQQNTFRKDARPPQFGYEQLPGAAAKDATSPIPSPDAKQGQAAASPPPAARRPNVRVTFQKNTGSSYSLYHLIFGLSAKTLKPEVRELSTLDDSRVSDTAKTYRFYEFISAITTVHLQNREAIRLPPPAFVMLTNK
jgi:hypothetical protein